MEWISNTKLSRYAADKTIQDIAHFLFLLPDNIQGSLRAGPTLLRTESYSSFKCVEFESGS
ncbi:hypothetical protein BM1_06283 [Bipolaris maydis]|nr:hypothetical protein BM1_06283 [Bipolaris maydis]